MNSFAGLGRLTKDVDLRYTQTGTAVAEFTLAINRKFKNKQTGEYDADFIRVKAFKKTAEILAEYVKKGQQIGISGRIQTGSYEKDGQRVFTTDVIVNDFTFVSAPKGSNSNDTSNYGQSNSNTLPTQEQATSTLYSTGNDMQQVDITDDDLPF